MFYDANIGERCETVRTWIRTTKRQYGLSRRNNELNQFTNFPLWVTTNEELAVIKKFVNSINSLLPRLSEIYFAVITINNQSERYTSNY